ncbi:hypothetical protein ACFU6K_29915 [Kitasatospora sp. NPDC057512]|uniref:hypothetical protein n=1 Tax=Kitasatospora sp. NPDC057512 TaxID=3346154 RepID=UPI0036971C48
MKTTKKLRNTALGMAAGLLALVGTVTSAGTAHADVPAAYMDEPGILYRGGHIEAGDTQLVLQNDGNLVLYRAYQDASLVHAVWQAPKTWGCGYKAIMQGDGNFVVYDANSRPCWSADTFKPSSWTRASLEVSALGGLRVVFVNSSGGRSSSWATIRSSDLY